MDDMCLTIAAVLCAADPPPPNIDILKMVLANIRVLTKHHDARNGR
jgi:hypothetical protein